MNSGSKQLCRLLLNGLVWVGLLGWCQIGWAAPPNVVVTIKPIHSLVSQITAGITTPSLLLPDAASPHTFQLKPSNLHQLQRADVLIWVGPQLETFMIKPLENLNPSKGIITLSSIPALKLLSQREGRRWAHDEHEEDHTHDHNGIDPHFWLSLDNAQTITIYLANYLASADSEHAKQYFANAEQLIEKLTKLKQTLLAQLTSVQGKPFLVYHDGYQYFEKEFGLNGAGTMVLNPHLPLSLHGLAEIKSLIKEENIHCVFRETEFNDSTVRQALNNLHVTVAELDPLGARIPAGPDNYEKMMLQLGETFKACLTQPAIQNRSQK